MSKAIQIRDVPDEVHRTLRARAAGAGQAPATAARRRAAPQPSPLVRTGQLSEDRAADARADFAELVVARYGHAPLAGRA